MRGHDRTSDRAPCRGRPWLILVALLAPAAGSLRAEDRVGVEPPGRVADPIDLAAETIRLWDAGDVQWLILEGQVAILQGGVEGVRADRAVVKVLRGQREGMMTSRLEIYAEGNARRLGPATSSGPALRLALATEDQLSLKPYNEGDRGFLRGDGVPPSQPILLRGFPELGRVASAPAPRPEAAARSAVPARAAAPQASPSPRPAPGSVPRAAVAVASATLPPLPATVPAGRPPVVTLSAPEPIDDEPGGGRKDDALIRTQFDPGGFGDDRSNPAMPDVDLPPAVEVPAAEATPGGAAVEESSPRGEEVVPDRSPLRAPPTTLTPFPDSVRPGEPGAAAAPPGPPAERKPPEPPTIPVMPGSQRVTRITSRNGTPIEQQVLPTADGVSTMILRGGIIIVTDAPEPTGTIDMSCDSAVIWRRQKGAEPPSLGPAGEVIEDAGAPMEVYLEGNVIVRQDTRQVAGNGDQKTYRAREAFYDFRTGRFVGLEAELDMFAPGLIAPTKLFSPRIDQYRPLAPGPGGKLSYGLERIQAERTLITGSRFPVPGYRFKSRSIDITHVVSSKADPISGRTVGNPKDSKAPTDLTWRFDARQNVFFLGSLPVFYYPRIVGDADDIEPPLRLLRYSFNNYLGQMVLADFNAFRLFGIRKPSWIDSWNVDIDYLSMRTKQFPALGTELGWFGKDFLADLSDPYHREKQNLDEVSPDGYFGYLDMWGLKDAGVDVLGGGPAIVTSNQILANGDVAGKHGYQRGPSGIPTLPNGVPAFQDFRGRVTMRHMQSLLSSDADPYEELRLQVEAGYSSDRYFLEEYYKRLSEVGLDQENLAYVIRQKDNWAASLWTEGNLQNFYTDTQWLPKLDYFRLGDSLLGNRLTYSQHSGADYANTHTANEVNNPNVFAFIPYDPISNTSGSLRTGRLYTNHEVDMPLNFDNIFRVVPYVQGQAVGWNNQLGGNAVGRVWGAAGARADLIAWRLYPTVQSDLFNVHGLNHKVSFEADYRDAYSNVKLDRIGIQDDLDDNTYELVRRYFAMTQYVGGVLPQQYDPRHLILRRALSPITGTTDVQASIQTLQLNLHSRLQTKRGPEGRRRVTDFMTLDLSSTYFPQATRDNFGKAFGQNMYNYQWFLGDRTSFISYGWFEFFNIGGKPTTLAQNKSLGYPFGLNMISSGISISRPPRGNIYIGYSVINTGPITTSALNPSVSYWLSPKWYGTFATSYDFGNQIWLASMFSFTRVGADYLTTIGWVVDPQRNNYAQIAIAISPRISPSLRFGSGSGLTQFDSRFAPTQ